MALPSNEDISRLHRYFAIESNNEFWSLSESSANAEEKQRLLTVAFSSLYHWSEVGTDENKHLAHLAVARALCVNESKLSLQFAKIAFDYFDGTGADWILAFTNAVLSHAFQIAGEQTNALECYERALAFQGLLSEEDKAIFDATFNLIPVPEA